MAATDWTRLLDGYSLLAIREWVNDLLELKAPLDSPVFTATNSPLVLPTNVRVGELGTGFLKYNSNSGLTVDPNTYLQVSAETWRAIQVNGTQAIGASSATPLNFVNGNHSVRFTYSSGLYAEVDLTKYSPIANVFFLDSNNKINTAYIPDSILGQLSYQDVWDASSSTGIVSNPSKGWYYICNNDGNYWPDGTRADEPFVTGDWAIWSGSGTQQDPFRWEKIDNTDAISSITLVEGTALTGPVVIPAASSTGYGLIKIGYSTQGKKYAVQLDENGKAFVNVPWSDNDHNYYHTPLQSSGLKIATGSGVNDMWVQEATASAYGVIKVGYATSSANRNYKVELDSNGNAFVNVPWQANTDHYPTAFSWTNGTTAGPTGSLTGNSGFSTVQFGAIPTASASQSGVVTTGDQHFGGHKYFHGLLDLAEISGQISVTPSFKMSWDTIQTLMYLNRTGSFEFALSTDGGTTKTKYQLLAETTGNTYIIATRTWVSNQMASYIEKSVLTTTGDIIYRKSNGTIDRLGIGTAGQVLTVNGGVPSWANPVDKYLSPDNTSNGLKIATGYGGLGNLYINYASASVAGVVTTDTQTFAGSKTFKGIVTFEKQVGIISGSGVVAATRVLHNDNPPQSGHGVGVNVHTFDQNEVTNILNGLNADGSSRSS